MSLDMALWVAGIVTEAALCACLMYKRAYRQFPVFSLYMFWGVLNDSLMMVMSRQYPGHFFRVYLVDMPIDSIIQVCVLVEVSWAVFRPVRSLLPKGTFLVLGILILLMSAAVWPVTESLTLAGPSAQWHVLLRLQQTFSIDRILLFLGLAAFSQMLAIGWRNRELQIATGLGFYSIMSLGAAVLYTHHASGDFFHHVNQAVTGSYLCSLFYWIASFLRNEAPRKEFSPRMQHLLISMAGTARAQRLAMEEARKGTRR